MNTDLRARLLATFQTGTAEELAGILELVHHFATHHHKRAEEVFTLPPAPQLSCKVHSQYSTTSIVRN
jgi:hypothetical protein